MGTRSLTYVHDEYEDRPLVCIYRQFDGYPEEMGEDLRVFLHDRVVGNGIGANCPPKYSNGMGELAAQLVMELKSDNPSGNIYLCPIDSEEHDVGQEYVYHIKLLSNPPTRAELALTVDCIYEQKSYEIKIQEEGG